MTSTKKFFLATGAIIFLIGLTLYSSSQLLGAPQEFIATPATSTVTRNFSFTVGTDTPLTLFGSTTLAVYGSTTIQTPINTFYAFRILNAASTSVFEVNTINASTTVAGQLNAQTLTVTSCTGCGGLTGGSPNTLTFWTSTTAVGATSSPTVGYITATSTTPSRFVGGLIANASTTIVELLSTNSTSTNATSTSLNVSGQVDFDTLTSAIVLTGAGGILAEYTGTSCVDQFPRSLSALGEATCATVADADVVNALTISAGTINDSTVGA